MTFDFPWLSRKCSLHLSLRTSSLAARPLSLQILNSNSSQQSSSSSISRRALHTLFSTSFLPFLSSSCQSRENDLRLLSIKDVTRQKKYEQTAIRTHDLRCHSPMLWPLDHDTTPYFHTIYLCFVWQIWFQFGFNKILRSLYKVVQMKMFYQLWHGWLLIRSVLSFTDMDANSGILDWSELHVGLAPSQLIGLL